MSPYWMIESALRALLMGVVIFAALKLLRIRQVRAQRTAWVLALLAALAMPSLMHWPMGLQLPAVRIPARFSTARASSPAATAHPTVSGESVHPMLLILKPSAVKNGQSADQTFIVAPSFASPSLKQISQPDTRAAQQTSAGAVSASRISAISASEVTASAVLARVWRSSLAIYLFIAGLLLTRLVVGIGLALRLRYRATPARAELLGSAPNGDVRVSDGVNTPVTIGSSIILPLASSKWDAAKLGVVLAHERAHVEQADFYVHLFAGLHCAIFWFSPFSWWLQRRLSALGEAMSDLAALQYAESRSSYAEVLLEFATSARQPIGAVAMARSSNLRPRIERLLNDRLFREAISGTQRHPFLAASVVPLALLASISLVRVQAAERSQASAAQAATSPVTPTPAVQSAPVVAASPVLAPDAAQSRAIVPDPAASADAESALLAASAMDAKRRAELEALMHPTPAQRAEFDKEMADILAQYRANSKDVAALSRVTADWSSQRSKLATEALVAHSIQVAQLRAALAKDEIYAAQSATRKGRSTHYTYSDWNGESFALVRGDNTVVFNGEYGDRFKEIRGKTKGDFIYYERDGKSYVIQDPALLAKAEALYAPMDALGKQQEELGRQQEALGVKQEALGKQQEEVKVPAPDLSKELASLDQAMQKLKALQASKDVTQESLADLQGQIGDIQGRLGELQGQAAEQQGKFGEQQGALGEQQGKLGEEQGRLGEQQGKLAEEAQRKLKPLIDQAIQDGRAKPVD